MIYLTDLDLQLESFSRYIDESTEGTDDLIEKAEESAIAFVKTFLNRYDLDVVFGDPIERDEFLASIIAIITVYKLLTRNKARKVSTDLREDYQMALRQLEKIQQGSILLTLTEKSTITSNSLGGNLSNEDFYI